MIFDNSGDNTQSPKNLALLLKDKAKLLADQPLQSVKNKSGVFVKYSYAQVYQHVVELAFALKKLGVKKGSHVGLISDNRREWLITDFALLSLGACDVPRGCDSMGVEIRFILNFADCEISVFENARQLEKVLEKLDECPNLKTAVLFDYDNHEIIEKAEAAGIHVVNYHYLESDGASLSKEEWAEIEKGMEEVTGDDLATIIFTSGTTGTPKGVQLTHDNYLAQNEAAHKPLNLMQRGDTWLTVLPIWHSFERAFVYIVIELEGSFAYSKPVGSVLLGDLAMVQPQWMNAVPRLWEAIANALFREIKKQNSTKRWVFNTFIGIGKAYYREKAKVLGLTCRWHYYPRFIETLMGIIPFLLLVIPHFIGEHMLYKKIRAKFGGKIRAGISGGGALQKDIEMFYRAIGFNLLEGYGLTEAAPVTSVNLSKKCRSGNIGPALSSFEVRIAELDENNQPVPGTSLKPGKKGVLMVRGRQVMKGYYNNPEATAAVIDAEGWLNTGDLAMISYDKELKIVGRAKDTIVLLGGENIEPAVIEKAVNTSPYIERTCCVGQDQKYVAALIVPDQNNVSAYAAENNIYYDNWENLLETKEIQNLFKSEIDSLVNAKTGFRACERIFNFKVLPNSFELGKEINGKQEMVRPKIFKIYKNEIEALFKEV